MEKQPNGQQGGKPKTLQIILEFAGDFIRLGKTLEDRQRRLTAASRAWNIANDSPASHEKELGNFFQAYKQSNPRSNETDLAALRKDMETLIARKLKMFPDDKRQIVKAMIYRVGNKERFEVVAARSS